MANYDNVIKGLCKPGEALGVLDNLQNGNVEKAAAGALAITQGVYDIISEDKELIKRLGIGASIANFAVDLPDAYDQITKYKTLKGSTYLNLVGDIAFLVGVLAPPLAVPMAIAGVAYTLLGIRESKREEQKERQRQFAKFASYLNSDEAREYMECPNCLTVSVDNVRVYETDGMAEFTIKLSKPLKEDLQLKVFTVEGTATKDDYSQIPQKREFYITIPAGITQMRQSILVYPDGKYEGSEEFLLVVEQPDEILQRDDVAVVMNKIVSGLATIIDIEQDKCPKPVTPNFSLNFPLPSAPSYYTPTYGGGAGGSSGGSSGGGSSSSGGGNSYTPISTTTPPPNVPYIECPNIPEKNSALVVKVNNFTNSNENVNSNNTENTGLLRVSSETLAMTNNSNSNEFSNQTREAKSTPQDETTNQNSKIYFDYNNDGFKENMLTWFSKDEAVLVNDINNNGFVDNGSEILGSNYTDKFGNKVIDILSLLDEFDTNNDGVIDNKDNTNLALWQDKNQNGKTDKDELIYLDDINSPIKSISLSKLDKLLSGYDRNGDLKINANDGIYNYVFVEELNDNQSSANSNNNANNSDLNSNTLNSINLYIYGDDSARAFLGDKRGEFIIQTNLGEKRVREVIFYESFDEIGVEPDWVEIVLQSNGVDPLIGSHKNETLKGTNGNDILVGGKGNDKLYGIEGDDTYIYNLGDGDDIIYDFSGNDTLKFGSGISKDDLVVMRISNSDLKISFKNNDGSIIITNIQYGKIENIEFENGDRLTFDELLSMDKSLIGTNGNDKLKGYDDIDNIIIGGKGDDELCGGNGGKNNIYIYNLGDGHDDIDIFAWGTGTIKFGDGINKDNIIIKELYSIWYDGVVFSQLKLTFKDNDGSIIFGTNNINKIEFSNGEILNLEDIENLPTDNSDLILRSAKFNNFDTNELNTDKTENTNEIKSLSQSGISEISLQSGYIGSSAKVGANNGEISFEYKWFESDNLDTIYEKDGAILNTASGRVRDINDAANDNPELEQGLQTLKDNLDKAFDDISLDMDSILENWILNDNIFGENLNLNETRSANLSMFLRTNEKSNLNLAMNLKSNETPLTDDNANKIIWDTLSDSDKKKISIVEAYRGAELSQTQRENPYIILGVLKEYDNIKFDAMKRIFASELFPSVSNCSQMLRALNLKLNAIISGEATPSETALAINLLAISLQRDYDYTIFHLTKVNQSPVVLTNPVIMNLLSKVGVNFSISNGEINGIIGKHNFGNSESESYDFSENANGVNINAKGGNDIIIGSEFNDEIIGENGNDIIFSGKGIDIVRGGAGNDLLIGSDDTTIYEYYLGDGDDIIYDDGGTDAIRFAFLNKDDLKFSKNNEDLIISVSNPYNEDEIIGSVTIKNGFTSGKIEKFYFDGAEYGFDEMIKDMIVENDEPSQPDDPQIPQNNPVKFESSIYEEKLQDIRKLNSSVVANDPDGDKIIFEILENAKNGKFTLNSDGSYTYEANSKFIGNDSVKIKVSDGKGSFDEAEIKFEISVSNPVIINESFKFDEDTSLNEFLSVENPIGGELSYEIISGSSNLSANIDEDGNLSVIPNANFNGNDSIIIKVTNEYGLSATKELNLTINAINDAPNLEIQNEIIELKNIFSYSGNIGASDIDGDELNYKVLNPSSNFTLKENGDYEYKSSRLDESFKIEISDNNGGVITKTITFKNLGYINDGNSDIVINGNESDILNLTNVNLSDLKFSLDGDDLVISALNSKTTIKDYLINKDMNLNYIAIGNEKINISDAITAEKKWWQLRRNATLNKSGTIVSVHSDEKLNGSNENDTIISTSGENQIYANGGDDIIFATTGDMADGGAGNDKLIANGDNITLSGGNGDDIYEISFSSNNVVIKDKEFVNLISGGNDTLKLNGDIDKSDISFFMGGTFKKDLIIKYGDKTTTILNQSNSKSAIERIELDSGEFITSAQIDKIIEQVNTYSNDNSISLNFDNARNNEAIMQIYMSGWGN